MSEGIVIGNLQIPIAKGEKGDKGEAGEIISISLVLLSPTATAYAINNGTTTDAQIELGIPKGKSISTVNINASGELVFTFNDETTSNVGQVVGKGISEVTVTEEYDFVVTYTDGTSVVACNLEEEILGAINDILEDYYTKTEIDEMGFITKDVNNLTNYTLKTNTGSSIELSINSSTYVMTLNLKNSAGTVISTGTVDLPLETMVVGATYDNTNKKIVLTLKNGSTIDVPVADLVSGLQSEITNANKLSADLVDDTNTTHKFVTASNKTAWNAKYDKPSGGIPKTDLASDVQTSLGKADTALQEHQDISGKEDNSNKTDTLDSSSTTTQYPNAKSVYDALVLRDEKITELKSKNAQLLADHPDIPGTGTELALEGTGDLGMAVDVGGNSTQKTTDGRQWFNKNFEPVAKLSSGYYNTRMTKTVLDNGIRLTFNYTQSSQFAYIGYIVGDISAYQGKTLRIKSTITPSGENIGRITVGRCDSNGENRTNLSYLAVSGNTLTVTIPTIEDTSTYLFVYIYVNVDGTINQNDYIDYTDLIITVDNEDMTYEDFTGGQASPNPTYKQDIYNVTGNTVAKAKSKNLATTDKDIILGRTTGQQDITLVDFGKDVTFDEMTFSLFFDNAIFTSSGNFCNFKKNDGTNQYKTRTFFINENNQSPTVNTLLNGRYSYTATNITFRKLILFTSANAYVMWSQGKCNVLLEASSTPTDTFIPHAENSVTLPLGNIELCKIGNFEDYFYKSNNKWYKKSIMKKVNLKDFTWKYASSYNGYFYSQAVTEDLIYRPANAWRNAPILCNTYKTTNQQNWNNENNSICYFYTSSSETSMYFLIHDERFTSASDFSDWVEQDNPYMWYALQTPVDIEITDTTLIEALDKLQEMQSYYDLTYVEGSSDNAKPILTAHAKKSLKVMQSEIDNINSRLTLLED